MNWRSWRRREREMEEEIAFHLAQERRKREAAGETAERAARGAEADFGGGDRIREELRAGRPWARVRAWGWDLWQAGRLLRRQPGWSLALVLTLALGLGAAVGVFSLVNAALLRPLPFPDAGSLAWISLNDPAMGASDMMVATPSELRAWAPDLKRVFAEYATVSGGGEGDTTRVNGVAMEPLERAAGVKFFGMLGVRPELGRLFQPADFASGAGRSSGAIISHAFWQRAFGGDPQVVGKRIYGRLGTLAGTPVIGVLPADFQLARPTDIWYPATTPNSTEEFRFVYIVGRRRPGVSNADVRTAMITLEARNPPPVDSRMGPQQFAVVVEPLAARLRGALRQPLLLLLGAVGCLWLLAAVNAATLLLARGLRRRPELATRLALGCPPGRLARHLWLEGALLAAAGAVAGCAGAWAGLRLLAARGGWLLPPATLRALVDLHASAMSWAVLGSALLLTVATVAVIGAAPAWHARRAGLYAAAAAAGGRSRGFRLLVVGEVALAAMLALGAGLLGRSFATLRSVPTGFAPSGRVSFAIYMPILRCGTPAACRSGPTEVDLTTPYLQQVLTELRALPGVTAAAGTAGLPLTDDDSGPETREIQVFPNIVTPGYFAALGIPIVAGRDFDGSDRYGGPKKVIVNQAFVHAFLAAGGALGQHVEVPRCATHRGRSPGPLNNPDPAGCIIVGVVGNVHNVSLAAPIRPAAYLDFVQDPGPGSTFVVRSRLPAARALAEVRALVARLPDAAGQRPFVYPPRTLDATVAASVATPRFRAWLGGGLAVLALLLTAIGIEGVTAYAVERRTREVGVRMALGASRGAIARLILRQALGWTMAGAAVGLAAGLVAARALASLLFGITPADVTTLLAVAALLIAVAALAAWLPARRAARTDPAVVLRSD
ncbi:MAG: ADOP family duplicated permease [Terriglobales bacterium]